MEKKEYTVSVIIPAFNREKTIKKTLDSLVDQSFKNFEVIVSDDGSKDLTVDIARTYSDKLNLKIITAPNSGGPARPRNLGIQASSAPWIAFLDSDDWWYKNKLEKSLPFLKDYDVLFHDLDIVTTQGILKKKVVGRDLGENVKVNLLTLGNAIANSSSMVRKECLLEVESLDESKDLVAVEDYDLWLKLASKNKKFKYLSETLGAYLLEEGNNITQKNERQIKRYEAVIYKHIGDLTFHDQEKALALLSYSRGRIYHALGMRKDAAKNYKMALGAYAPIIKLKAMAGLCLLLLKVIRGS